MSLLSDLTTQQDLSEGLTENKVSRFCYTQEAYDDNIVASPQSYSYAQENNIPSSSLTDLHISETQVDKGFRVTFPSVPKMLFNHIFGRASYNLNKLIDFYDTVMLLILNALGTANGLATLDNSGRIPESQAVGSLMFYRGAWNASTNTPTLVDGTGTKNDMYVCSVAGTVNFGSGNIHFLANDRVVYNGSAWEKLSSGSVITVSEVSPSLDGNIDLSTQTNINKVLNVRVQRMLFWWEA